MSTGGKVMVVLITLLTMVWVGLMSMVSRLNANHGEVVKKGEVALTALEKEVHDTRNKLRDMEDEVEAKHFANDEDRTKSRLEYNDLHKALSEVQENLARINGLLDNLDKANVKTEANMAERKEETAIALKKIEETQAASAESKSLNGTLMAKLVELREKFVKISEENRALARKLGESTFEDVSAGKRALVTGR